MRRLGLALLSAWMMFGCSGSETTTTGGGSGTDGTEADIGGGTDGTEDAGVVDTGPDSAVAGPDADASGDTAGTPAAFGDACIESNANCTCVEHMGDSVCTKSCEGGCPDGWICGAGGVCRSLYPTLCRPCTQASDCAGNPGTSHCVRLDGQGGFCGAGCGGGAACPDGWLCQSATNLEGTTVTQCVPAGGECPCSAASIAQGRAAWCVDSTDGGSCVGQRTCTADGLGPCEAGTPSAEVCNGADDDCDGLVDEDTCNDGNECTSNLCLGAQGCMNGPLDGGSCGGECLVGGTCVAGTCQGDPGLDCDDNNICTADDCDPVEGCVYSPLVGACNDGDPCTGDDTCVDGLCVGEPGGGCKPGDSVLEPCGQCGQRMCLCAEGCVLGNCGECSGEGPCAPGDKETEDEACGEGCSVKTRTRTCGNNCEWGAWTAWSACSGGGGGECQPDETQTESKACGNCGVQTRTRACTDQCGWGAWSDWSGCASEGVCSPAAVDTAEESCGNCGTRTRTRSCTAQCQWGSYGAWSGCSGQGVCAAGAKENQSGSCGNCGSRTRTRTCSNSCSWGSWGAWGSCGGQGVCAPGSTNGSGCDPCAVKTCNNSCQWGGCNLKAGAQCLYEGGSNWKCCGGGKWHFCLGPNYGCIWSDQCAACSGCGC